MKIAITGGSGFIGKWLLRELYKENDVIILGRDVSGKVNVEDKSFQYISTDYSTNLLGKQLAGCEAVVHLAAKRMAGMEVFENYFDNIRITANLFEACWQLRISNIINLSSQSVYSQANQIPWLEADFACPSNFYGLSKLIVENIADYYNKNHVMKIKSLRASQVLGWGERDSYMLMTFVNRAAAKKKLNVYGRGEGRREYIYVRDLVDVLVKLLAKDVAGVYNIGSGINYSHREVAEIINDVFNNRDNLKIMPDKPEDKSIYLMNSDKIKEELNWRPKWWFKDALRDIQQIILSDASRTALL